MRISVFGLGYVGSVTAAGLTHLGHEVVGVDVVPEKLQSLQAGVAPVKEPQLDELLGRALREGRLRFTASDQEAVLASDCAMVCVGTPSTAEGEVALGAVRRCVRRIAKILAKSDKADYCIVIRSTVPPGTTQQMAALVQAELAAQSSACRLTFCMHPEFTREGVAVHDFLHPALIVFGEDEADGIPILRSIYPDMDVPVMMVDTRTAELIKYTNNAFHALKVAFANEIGRIAEAYGVDSHRVMDILCADTKLNISSKYLRPGFAFGGSCLPKDLRGITSIAQQQKV
ncbi:MAG: UDP-glucose/GDP-mannose dehydrogenase family protein, partial [Bacteroidetes bacterium]